MPTAADFWDAQAPSYAKSPVRDVAAYEQTLARVRTHLSKDMDVIEIGCGTGSTALRLCDAVATYHATDVSTGMIKIALDKLKETDPGNLSFAASPATEFARDYDAVLAFNLLHLIKDVDPVLEAISGALPKGGLFISKTVVNGPKGWGLKWGAMKTLIPVMQALGKAPEVAFRDHLDWEAQVERHGFEIIERGDYPAQPCSRFLVARSC